MHQDQTLHVATAPPASREILGFEKFIIVRSFRAPATFLYGKEVREERGDVLQTGFDGPLTNGSIGHAIREGGFIVHNGLMAKLGPTDTDSSEGSVVFKRPLQRFDKLNEELTDFQRSTKVAGLTARYGLVRATSGETRPAILTLLDFLLSYGEVSTFRDAGVDVLPFQEIVQIVHGGNGYGTHFVGFCRDVPQFVDQLQDIAARFDHKFKKAKISEIPVW